MNPSDRTITAFLNFDGRCEEALAFYTTALGATVDVLMRYRDAPESEAGPMGDPEKIMHCSFRIGATTVMASDCQCAGAPAFAGISLALDVADEADAARCFTALGAGGVVHMPLGKTFWSSAFGVVSDRFGVCWMINARANHF